MKNFWKFIVLACLLTQFGFAYNTNQQSTPSFQKKDNTSLTKENSSAFQLVQLSIERVTLDLKNNNRIPVGIGHYPTELQSLSVLRDTTPKIVLSNQDIDRYNGVSILLFPFHYFW
ncbi:hypothetical protein [Flavobacterium sp. WC2509]|uniref:hypothetical protein n=1 Tax=Flavobacterium sp. WC2509 TaxID=3461406 RepID=UPI0040440D18